MNIKKGSVIREHKYGTYIETTVITDPIISDKGKLKFMAETNCGKTIEYLKSKSSFEVVK